MAYSRFGKDSDVYAFASDENHFSIYLPNGDPIICNSLEAFSQKMLDLKERGLAIPDHTFERIKRELAEKQNATMDRK